MNDFDGLVAVVTGGASGIGAATASLLLSRGARVTVLDRDTEGAPDGTTAIRCDITDSDAVDAAMRTVSATFGALDVLINNAGIGAVGDVAQNDDAEWAKVLDVNVISIPRVTRAALPLLRRSANAAIVNTCSAVAVLGVRQRALYSASKGAVLALTLAMAADHAGDRIRVNAVAPGTTETPWVSRLLAGAEDAEPRPRPCGNASRWVGWSAPTRWPPPSLTSHHRLPPRRPARCWRSTVAWSTCASDSVLSARLKASFRGDCTTTFPGCPQDGPADPIARRPRRIGDRPLRVSVQYLAVRYTEGLAEAGAAGSVGSDRYSVSGLSRMLSGVRPFFHE